MTTPQMTQIKLPSFTELTSHFSHGRADEPKYIPPHSSYDPGWNGSYTTARPFEASLAPPTPPRNSYIFQRSPHLDPESPTRGSVSELELNRNRPPSGLPAMHSGGSISFGRTMSLDAGNSHRTSAPASPTHLRQSFTSEDSEREARRDSELAIEPTNVAHQLEHAFDMMGSLTRNCNFLMSAFMQHMDRDRNNKVPGMSIQSFEAFAAVVPETLLDDTILQAAEIATAFHTLKLFIAANVPHAGARVRPPTPKKQHNRAINPKSHRQSKSEGSIGLNESVSLKVDPPKPFIVRSMKDVESMDISSHGSLHQELSMKPKNKCIQCGSSTTPEWRKGPSGARTLCNACGLFHSKLVRKKGVDSAAEIMLQRRRQGSGADRRIPN